MLSGNLVFHNPSHALCMLD